MNVTSDVSYDDPVFTSTTYVNPSSDIFGRRVRADLIAATVVKDGTIKPRYNRYIWGVTSSGLLRCYLDWDGSRSWCSIAPQSLDDHHIPLPITYRNAAQRIVQVLHPRTMRIRAIDPAMIIETL
jgi:hypothetical protein